MKQLSILVVDDDPVIRKLLGERLKKADYIVETAENGAVAKERIAKERYDVVITDLIMPPGNVDGIEVLEFTKENDMDTEVLLITAHSSIATAVAAMKKGANDYLEKPINFDELFLRLDKIANVQTIHKNAMDLRAALDTTEDEAANTIRTLEFLTDDLKKALEEIRSTLQDEGLVAGERIHEALEIIKKSELL